jgi:hypothetical protein
MRGKADTQVIMLTLITADQLVPEDPSYSANKTNRGQSAN